MNWEWVSLLTQTKAEQILSRLKKDQNYQLWQLSKETMAIPEVRRFIEGE